MRGSYVYVLPSVAMYKRVSTPSQVKEMMQVPGFMSIHFSGNMCVIKTRPGYASSIAYNIDASGIPHILGTIAGDDTIFIVIKEAHTAERRGKRPQRGGAGDGAGRRMTARPAPLPRQAAHPGLHTTKATQRNRTLYNTKNGRYYGYGG